MHTISIKWKSLHFIIEYSTVKSAGSVEEPKSSTRMIWYFILEGGNMGGYSVHCDDGWFIVMETK
jgi:hypothetical protein